jgi:hypothetical protein
MEHRSETEKNFGLKKVVEICVGKLIGLRHCIIDQLGQGD